MSGLSFVLLRFGIALACASIAVLGSTAAVQAQVGKVSPSSWPAPALTATTGPRRYVSDQKGTFHGRMVRYTATLEETILTDRQGRPATSIFTTSFVARRSASDTPRPVMFVFNGGPGGASNTLMFGALGPKRMTSFSMAALSDPRTPVGDNADCPLDVADLVFIDPPETGYGRPLPGTDPKTFRSNDGDSFAVAQFILHWLAENHRGGSPIYIAGESYGSSRAVMLARDLGAATPKVNVTGLVLISQAINYNGPSTFGIKRLPDPMRAITRLQDTTALAWYYGLIDNQHQTLAQAVEAARQFERSDYATALIKGNRMSEGERNAIAGRLHDFTGLSADYFIKNDLRVQDVRKDLLASRGLALGQFDGRETETLNGIVADEDRDWDKAVLGLTTAMENYVAQTFRATGLPKYRSIVADPYGFEESWQYIAAPHPGLDVVLNEQIAANPRLRVMVPQGVFDTTSSMGATEALFAQMPNAAGRVDIVYYPGGHMLYSDDDGRTAFTNDLRSFVTGGSLTGRPFPNPRPRQDRPN